MPKGIFSNPKERAIKIATKLKRGNLFPCIVCGTNFWRKPSAIKKGDNKFCTRGCYFKWQKGKNKVVTNPARKDKENNPNWKGGIGGLNVVIRRSREYSDWRESVFKRDDWNCQKCGARSKSGCYVRIEAHHKKPFATFPELRFVVDNGLTLCKPCHDKEPKGREILCIK